MLSFSVIGCGAAGNKAVIDLMSIGYNKNKCYMINSTTKDLPAEYKDQVMVFGSSYNRLGGCGKERAIGRKTLLNDLKAGTLDLDQVVSDDDQAIILVGSTEGGSGSSSMPILAKYFKQVYDKNVICVFFFGFNDDVRGMQNSIELCQELSDEYTVICISNEKFLEENDHNKFKAEKAANALFCEVVKVLSGAYITPGTQMIDDTDLYKVVTTPGYMIANTYPFNRPKSAEAYAGSLNTFLNNQGFVDPSKNPGAKRIAMIFDIPDADDAIDYSGTALRKMYGEPYEFFTHMNNQAAGYRVSYIVSGMKLPSEEITAIFNSYMERTAKVNKSKDDFFDIIGEMHGDTEDRNFDMLRDQQATDSKQAKKDFFRGFKMGEPEEESKKDRSLDERKQNFEY